MNADPSDANYGVILAGRYKLLRHLGDGTMARVYVAEQLAMSRNVAVKLLRDEVQLDDVAVQRFRQEIVAVARLRSPHTIQFYDAGTSERGSQFIAMELLAGESLRQRLERDRRLPPHEVMGIAAQVGASLQEAHEAGVLHRDLKPENVYLCSHPTPLPLFVKVLDFGLAKIVDTGGDEADAFQLTGERQSLGTPAYMAPESIVRGRPRDHRLDIYALGTMCFEMLTGRRPYEARSAQEMVLAQVRHPIPRVSEVAPDLPPALDALFDSVLAKDPAGRPSRATDVAAMLAQAFAGS